MTELETKQRAKMYWDKLAQGIDPINNRAVLAYVSGLLGQVLENGGAVGYHAKTLEFSLTPEQWSRVNIIPYPIHIQELVEELIGLPAIRI